MSNVVVKMKDGSKREFLRQGRSGGSYSVSVVYEGGMAIIEDEYQTRTAIPIADITEVVESQH